MAALFDESEVALQHSALLKDKIGQKLTAVVAFSVDLLRKVLLGWECKDEREMAIWVLGSRIINGFGAATKLLECGYFGPTSAQLRDMAETGNLLDFFKSDPSQIDPWLKLIGRDRQQRYKFGNVRDHLDLIWKKRFDFHSEYGIHPSAPGIYAIENDGYFHTGPHFSESKFRGFYKDIAMDASLVTRSFLDCITGTFGFMIMEKFPTELQNFENAELEIRDIYGPI